ncbi:DUF5916 domain-containing protein [Longimicrobium sp.]|uniref:DUF5916 domain-containing protein n=1 Tax=Longimicrobium sp. TaxID=2029185 RepID=UPI003B3BEA4E
MRSSLRLVLPAATAIFAATSSVNAQSPRPAVQATPAAATLRAARVQGDMRIDGRLDEAAWQQAQPATEFTQSYPQAGAAPTVRTEARVLYDDENVYVGVRMLDASPDSIAAPLARRDASGVYSDWLHVIIDSRHDRRSGFRFSVNPRGVQRDVYHFDDGNEDASWDAVWNVAAAVDSAGWTAEYRIPLSQLRFGGEATDARTWGFQVMRDIARRGERASWSPWTQNTPGFASSFGTLTGLEGIRSPRALEILPYASARVTRAPGNSADPFYSETEPGMDAGADLRLGLPQGFTLSATINPDFGQVEADPAEVNLSAFETFQTERRPFFTEGSDIFQFGGTRAFNSYGSQDYFYTRRVGRSPQRTLSGSGVAFVDAPQQTRILGAAKVSGRTPAGWSVGVMNAVTGREGARFVAPDGTEGTAQVEPLSNYFVGRVRRDLNAGSTVLGGLFTAANRELGDEALEGMLHRGAYVAGADFLHTWGKRAWSLSGYAAGTRVNGTPGVILGTQRGSARYYQRPDADYLEVDPERTSLSGHIGEVSLAHSGSWNASVQYKEVSPGFEINDLGYHTRADARSIATYLGRNVNKPVGVLRNHSYAAWQFAAWNFGGDRILDGYAGRVSAGFTNFWGAGIQAGIRPEYLNDRLTRGGPLSATPAQWNVNGWVETDSRKPLFFGTELGYRQDASGLRERSIASWATLRPSTAVRVQLEPRLSKGAYTAQYVNTTADLRAADTYGARYVFGELDQTTFSLGARVDWTFTPRLSLQMFAQPFVSAGRYTAFKELATPGEFAFAEYGGDRGTLCRIDGVYVADPVAARTCPAALPATTDPNFVVRFGDPDFNVRSLRGNAVLRWEYRPGSTLFFVWQQERSGFESMGDFDFGRDARAIFDGPAHNVFLIKASYWIGG